MRRTAVFICLVAAAIVAVAIYGVESKGTRSRGAERQQPGVPVSVATAATKDFPITLGGVGTVRVSYHVEVHAQITGTSQKVVFIEGQTVHTGDLLAEIDARPYEAALQQAQAALAKDQAML